MDAGPGTGEMSQAVDQATPDIIFEVLDGTAASAHADELQALYADVFAGPAAGTARPQGSRNASGFSAASRAMSWLRPATAVTWSVTRPGSRSGRPPPGGGT